jgi:hypothetical protein
VSISVHYPKATIEHLERFKTTVFRAVNTLAEGKAPRVQ